MEIIQLNAETFRLINLSNDEILYTGSLEDCQTVMYAEEDKDDMKEAIDTIETLRNELNEVILLNAKLLYVNKVHERLDGFKTYTMLPDVEYFALYHPKTIDKQEKQNSYYDTL